MPCKPLVCESPDGEALYDNFPTFDTSAKRFKPVPKIDCHHWAHGHCRLGDNCAFRHSSRGDSANVPSVYARSSKRSRDSPEPPERPTAAQRNAEGPRLTAAQRNADGPRLTAAQRNAEGPPLVAPQREVERSKHSLPKQRASEEKSASQEGSSVTRKPRFDVAPANAESEKTTASITRNPFYDPPLANPFYDPPIANPFYDPPLANPFYDAPVKHPEPPSKPAQFYELPQRH